MLAEHMWTGMLEMQHSPPDLNFLIWPIGEVDDLCWDLRGKAKQVRCPGSSGYYRPMKAPRERASSLIDVYAQHASELRNGLRKVIEAALNPSDLPLPDQGRECHVDRSTARYVQEIFGHESAPRFEVPDALNHLICHRLLGHAALPRFRKNIPLFLNGYVRCPGAALRSRRVGRPGPLGFEGRDRRFLLQDVAEFVDAFQQAVLRECIHRELHTPAVGERQGL